MNILVTGGSGFIGSSLIEALLARKKHQVYALVRQPDKLAWLKGHPQLHFLVGDLLSLPPLPDNIELVFHLAGLTKSPRPSDYYTVNQAGTARLLERIFEKRLRPKFVLLSSLAAGRPSNDGKPVKEEEPPAPASPYGKSKLLAELETLKYKDEMPVIIFRAAAIYGPRDQDFLQFFQNLKKGWLFTFNKKLTLSLCYVVDLVRALMLGLDKDYKSGEIYNVADPVPRSWEEIGQKAAVYLGVKPQVVRVPLWLVKVAARLSEVRARITGKPSPVNISKYLDMEKLSWTADVSKIKKDLGFETIWDFEKALKETLDWYKKNGWL
ncbi:MAG: NAD-dependent epimerase/dehydratase family protein [Candidatus Aminicenantes bacterium]|nr:NAD-dependent epimerase/dehydratase family protein [Candidatus Aminicenantes bacterium]